MKQFFFFFLSLILVLNSSVVFSSSDNDARKIPTKVNKDLPFSKGVNLSNWLEAWNLGNAQMTYFSKQDFIDLKNLGVDVIRVPIFFEQFSSGKPDYIVQDWLFECLDNAISWCEELQVYLIIDFHNYTAYDTKTSSNVEKVLLSIWQQISTRYKDKSKYIIYEIMNEPHIRNSDGSINIAKWNKIQGKVIETIRNVDSKHSIIVAGGDFNSIESLLKMPAYNDSNLIYNFHDYTPFLFTHQGTNWTDIERLKNIPFPYQKEKMPSLPKNAKSHEKWYFENYKRLCTQDELEKNINKIVDFANERNVPLMCNEYGTYMKYASHESRMNWYKMKVKQLDDRNIARISWDYFGGFGLFKTDEISIFPDDLNEDLLKIMNYKKPNYKNKTWFELAKEKNDYTIYKNGFSNRILVSGWTKENDLTSNIIKKDENIKNESYIFMNNVNDYDHLTIDFRNTCNFVQLLKSQKSLEFEIRLRDKFSKISVYFMNSKNSEYEWRMAKYLSEKELKPNNQWQKISIKLSDFSDIGAWDEKSKSWIPGKNAFNWKDVRYIRFDVEDSKLKNGLDIKNIIIK